MSARYVLQQDGKDGYRFTLVTHGGEVLMTSGLYTVKDTALRHISAARTLARRRETGSVQTLTSGTLASAKIRSLSSSLHVRRRSRPRISARPIVPARFETNCEISSETWTRWRTSGTRAHRTLTLR